MLMKSPTTTPEPVMTYARTGRHAVRLATDTRCPHCTRRLRASDVEADFGEVRLICGGCHRDVLVTTAE